MGRQTLVKPCCLGLLLFASAPVASAIQSGVRQPRVPTASTAPVAPAAPATPAVPAAPTTPAAPTVPSGQPAAPIAPTVPAVHRGQLEPEHTVEFAVPVACFSIITCIALYYSYVLLYIYFDFKSVVADDDDSRTFRTYIGYRFSYWFVWTEHAVARLMFLASLSLLLVGTSMYWLASNKSVFLSFQKVAYWLMAPDAGVEEKKTVNALIGFIASILGLFLFAILVTFVQDSFNNYLQRLKAGHSPVIERGHIVIVGFSNVTIGLVQELCWGQNREGGATIAILAEQGKVDVEQQLTDFNLDRNGSKVVVRSGKGYVIDDLLHVSANTCSTIVLSPDYSAPKEQRDALILRTFVVLCAEGWPSQGRIVLVCTLQKNKPLFEQIGGTKASIIMVDPFISGLMVESSKGLGLGRTIRQLFTFEGEEFYITNVPKHLVDRSFFDAAFYYPEAILVGVCNKAGDSKCLADLCPDNTRLLKDDDELVLYCAGWDHVDASKDPFTNIPPPSKPEALTETQHKSRRVTPEKIFVMGWNESIGLTLLNLDPFLPPKSEVLTFCQTPVDERKLFLTRVQARWSRNFSNISKFDHVVGTIGARSQLESLQPPIELATRVFLLLDDNFSSRHADANTVLMSLQIRDILRSKGIDIHKIHMFTEVGNTETDSFCTRAGILDYIYVDQLRSGIIAMITLDERLNQVYEAFHGLTFKKRDLKDYLPKGSSAPESLTFFDAMCMVRSSRDVLLGWTLSGENIASTAQIVEVNETVETNPNKLETKKWVEGRDKLIVLSVDKATHF